MSILSAFNEQLFNLSKNLSELYSNDPDLELSKNTILILKNNNPRKLQVAFNTYIYKFKKCIMDKDETFLLNNNFIKDNIENNIDNNIDYAEKIMNNLKKYWIYMDENSKENIWKYFQVLIVLNEKCLEEQQKCATTINYNL